MLQAVIPAYANVGKWPPSPASALGVALDPKGDFTGHVFVTTCVTLINLRREMPRQARTRFYTYNTCKKYEHSLSCHVLLSI